jgi:Tol biopolymer transport system component
MGGPPRRLADRGGKPSVSPDGTLIAFTTESRSGREIWVMRADGQNPRKLVGDFETDFGLATWAPDSGKIAYVKFKYHPGTKASDAQIELANVEDGRSRVLLSDPHLGPGLAWCPDGRLIYSLEERPPSQDDFNLWSVGINHHSGQLLGAPLRITGDPGGIDRVSVSAERDVYISELEANGTKMRTPRLLTLDERQDFPYDWTPDGKAVLFTSDRVSARRLTSRPPNLWWVETKGLPAPASALTGRG